MAISKSREAIFEATAVGHTGLHAVLEAHVVEAAALGEIDVTHLPHERRTH